jgi:hypothetical protein
MARSKPHASFGDTLVTPSPADRASPPQTPADVIARGWISVLEQLDPAHAERASDPHDHLGLADHWTVEILIKLGFAAPDCAYEVGLRIVELTDNAWILQNAAVGVFEPLLRRDRARFSARIAADADRLPRLAIALAHGCAPLMRRQARG